MDEPPPCPDLVCSECGCALTLEAHSRVYYIGEVRPLMPVFCSRQCAEDYDATSLTLAKLLALRCWLRDSEPEGQT